MAGNTSPTHITPELGQQPVQGQRWSERTVTRRLTQRRGAPVLCRLTDDLHEQRGRTDTTSGVTNEAHWSGRAVCMRYLNFNLCNLQCLCRRHHRAKQAAVDVELTPDGTYRWTSRRTGLHRERPPKGW